MRMVFPRVIGIAFVVVLFLSLSARAQARSSPPPAPQQPAPPAPQQPTPSAPQQPTPPAAPAGAAPTTPAGAAPAATPAPLAARTFTAPTGVIFNVVRPDRVVDFELVIGYLQAALEKSTNPQIREQARGWRTLKATEPGPNGTVLYVFLLDPTVNGADYALGPILGDAYPDQIEQIWKLYQGALASPGSLLNLTPVQPPPLPTPGTAPAPAAAPPVRPAPPPAP